MNMTFSSTNSPASAPAAPAMRAPVAPGSDAAVPPPGVAETPAAPAPQFAQWLGLAAEPGEAEAQPRAEAGDEAATPADGDIVAAAAPAADAGVAMASMAPPLPMMPMPIQAMAMPMPMLPPAAATSSQAEGAAVCAPQRSAALTLPAAGSGAGSANAAPAPAPSDAPDGPAPAAAPAEPAAVPALAAVPAIPAVAPALVATPAVARPLAAAPACAADSEPELAIPAGMAPRAAASAAADPARPAGLYQDARNAATLAATSADADAAVPAVRERAATETQAPPSGAWSIGTVPAVQGAGENIKLAGPAQQWQQPLREALGERIQVQLGSNTEHALIRLDPPMLGRIEILISHSAGALQVTLSASHGEVLRQLHTISESMQHDLAQRQFSEVAVNVTPAPRSAAASPFGEPQGRGRQGGREQQPEADPGRALHEAGQSTATFSMNQ
jgi:flagellar hook-length control protein FliK